MAMVAVISVWGGQLTMAQGGFPGRPSIPSQAFNACTTTNYTDIISKALGIASVDLRKDVVNGQSVQDIATSANVDLKTVTDAYQTARKADIDQAVKDAVLTQDEATAMEATPGAPGTQPAPNGTPRGPRQGGGGGGATPAQFPAQFPDISTIRLMLQLASGTPPAPGGGGRGGFGGGFGGFGGIGAGTFNLVKQYEVAATALNMKCTDLVETLITPPGKSIVAVAADQKVDPQTISDALTKAYKDALAQDVTDGVITQAQSDQLSPAVDKAVAAFVSNPLVMGRQGPPPTPAQ